MEEEMDWHMPMGAPSLYVLNHPFADGVLEMAGVVQAPEKVLVRIDHKVPPNAPEESLLQRQLMEAAKRQGLSFAYGRGMAAHEAASRVQARDVVLACDPDVLMVGAKGALGLCVSREEMAKALASDAWIARESRLLRISFVGEMASDVDARDVGRMLISRLAGRVTADSVLVFRGGDFSLEERMILCGMMQKLGVRSALFRAFSGAGERVIDLAEVRPSLLLPEGRVTEGRLSCGVQAVFVGGAYGGFLKDMEILAKALRGKRIARGVRLSVAPVSAEVYEEAASLGYLAAIMKAGGLVLSQCATPDYEARIGEAERMISNDIHNEAGYAGGEVFLSSTRAAAEAALSEMPDGSERKEIAPQKKSMPCYREKKAGMQAPSARALEGRVWKFGDDIDTDIIIPTQHLSYASWEEVKRHMFEPLRPELAQEIREGDILVAGSNFGCGSSREQAAEVIATSGIRCIIAKSFARIFFRNAINNGVLLIECPALPDHVREGDTVKVIINDCILHQGKRYPIPRMPDNLYRLIMAGGLVKSVGGTPDVRH